MGPVQNLAASWLVNGAPRAGLSCGLLSILWFFGYNQGKYFASSDRTVCRESSAGADLASAAAAAVTATFRAGGHCPRVRPAAPPESASANGTRFVLDMVQNNPASVVVSAFCDPRRLADWGYDGQAWIS